MKATLTPPRDTRPSARPSPARRAAPPDTLHTASRAPKRRGVRRTTARWLLALAGALGIGLALVAISRADDLAPLGQRTSDGVVSADLRRMAALQRELDAAPAADRWRRAYAHALLLAARTEYLDNDRTRFDEAAFDEARAVAGAIARGEPVVTEANAPAGATLAGSTKVRPDLWEKLEAMKRSPGFECAAEPLAGMEVQLQWAGNEQVDQGDCNTSPHVAEAERLAADAAMKLEACKPQAPVAAQPVAPEPAKPVPTETVPVPVVPTPEELRIPRNVHFALDRYAISERSRQVIAGIAEVLNKYPSITVRLEGHTDSRASAAYNLRLSQNRVNAVRDQMVRFGVDPSRITTAFKGEADLKVSEDSKTNFARNRRVEMVFVDPEGQDIKAEDQEEDLQLESDQSFRRGIGTRR